MLILIKTIILSFSVRLRRKKVIMALKEHELRLTATIVYWKYDCGLDLQEII